MSKFYPLPEIPWDLINLNVPKTSYGYGLCMGRTFYDGEDICCEILCTTYTLESECYPGDNSDSFSLKEKTTFLPYTSNNGAYVFHDWSIPEEMIEHFSSRLHYEQDHGGYIAKIHNSIRYFVLRSDTFEVLAQKDILEEVPSSTKPERKQVTKKQFQDWQIGRIKLWSKAEEIKIKTELKKAQTKDRHKKTPFGIVTHENEDAVYRKYFEIIK